VTDDYVGPFQKKKLAADFGVTIATIARMLKDGRLRAKPGTSTKFLFVHKDDYQGLLKKLPAKSS
jgi:hypothetical protein